MLLRIPYTTPLPSFPPIPSTASTLPAAVTAVSNFLQHSRSTLILSGAGISVASGLPDYRGPQGTYTLNKEYRPIFFGDFVHNDGMRRSVSHPAMPITNLHGLLSTMLCLTCKTHFNRSIFQQELHRLNPTWSAYLEEMRSTPDMPIKRNPDGDIDVPGVEYESFRYPPCQVCLKNPVYEGKIRIDGDGAMERVKGDGDVPGVVKPTLVFFGESLGEEVKKEAEGRVDAADAVLVLGSSLATYSAWRLVKRAKDQGKKVGIVNLGGVRGEDAFWDDGEGKVAARYRLGDGTDGVRVEFDVGEVLEGALEVLQRVDNGRVRPREAMENSTVDRADEELREIEMYAP
ncbi:hypothetical protein ABW19_dt0201934 [Dactylella cylindrospora]|nr:hypothetical protein ABW19_dt0201934 [Dactylella cylindrospora]